MKTLYIIILIGLFFSCQPADNTENYLFSSDDYQYLPTVYKTPEAIFLFKNELNEEVVLSVISYDQKTKYEGSGFANTTSHPGNYESIIIELSIANETNSDCVAKKISAYKSFDESLTLFFENNTAPNPCNSTFILQRIESPFKYSSMSINGEMYKKVVTFNYEKDNTPFFHDDYRFDIVYYDLKSGFVGFDDTEAGVHFSIIKQ